MYVYIYIYIYIYIYSYSNLYIQSSCLLRKATKTESVIDFGSAQRRYIIQIVYLCVARETVRAQHIVVRMCLRFDRSVTGVTSMRMHSGALS